MVLGVLVGLAIVIPLYLLPTIVASRRHLARTRTTGWLNLFLGWTTVGWIVLVFRVSGGGSKIGQRSTTSAGPAAMGCTEFRTSFAVAV